MTDAMTHRGPNDRGTFSEPGVALGVRRLSIVDVSGGHQPVSSEDGTVWAIQNGELYNHDEIRATLRGRGHSFKSRCDTEILPHLYEDLGAVYPERLRGKFGTAVWDGRRRRLVLARDRLGVKPLYYAHVGDVVVFGSELKSVLASGLVEPRLDYEAIDAYLTHLFFPAPLTPLAGVRKLMPGSRLVVDDYGVREERYWDFPSFRPELTESEDEIRERLLAEVDEAVRLRLMSDVPLGAMLSGGLDSTLVVALMARHMAEPVKTFSVGFAEDGDANELDDARFVSKVYGTDHHELELSYFGDEVDLAELVWALDEPLAELSALGFLALSQLASAYVRVALSGQGADELLAGYRKHRAAALVGRLGWVPDSVRSAGAAVAPRRMERAARALAARDPVERLLAMSTHLDADDRLTLFRGPLEGSNGRLAVEAVADRLGGEPDDPLPVTLHIDGQLALVDNMLHYFDRASMAHSLEVRVPFLDHRVVEYCARIPQDMKLRGRTTKWILREAARGLVPDRVIDKPKLGFFRGASEGWLRAQLERAVGDYVLAPDARLAEFLDREEVAKLYRDYGNGNDPGRVHLLIAILMLEIWLSTFLPRAMPARDDAAPRVAVES
jgi:asparagine synthase (glutamine-hydrolysing)